MFAPEYNMIAGMNRTSIHLNLKANLEHWADGRRKHLTAVLQNPNTPGGSPALLSSFDYFLDISPAGIGGSQGLQMPPHPDNQITKFPNNQIATKKPGSFTQLFCFFPAPVRADPVPALRAGRTYITSAMRSSS
jgi:hypothetical protein